MDLVRLNSHASWGALELISARSAARSIGAEGSCDIRAIARPTKRPMDAGTEAYKRAKQFLVDDEILGQKYKKRYKKQLGGDEIFDA